ncbi:MAG: prolyl oligopeptidase family serine peptidase [Flammeovirgaceae bacterium]
MKNIMKNSVKLLSVLTFGWMLTNCQKPTETPHFEALKYPESKKVDTVDIYFGEKVSDPYRWLENDTSAETGAWVDAQNEVTFGYLEKIPFRDRIKKRLSDIFNYPRYSQPFKVGEYYFFYKNDGLQNQSVIYVQKGLEGTPEVFLNPNELSSDGTITASIASVSKDDKFVAIVVNRGGSDRQEFYVMNVADKKFTSDTVKMAKFSGASWYKDGFFYSAYGDIKKGVEVNLSQKNEYHTVYYHKLGTPQSADQIIYKDDKNKLRNFYATVSEDEKFLFLNSSEGTSGAEILIKDLSKNSDFKVICPGFANEYTVIDNIGDKILVMTNMDAPKYKLVLIDPAKPTKDNWKEIIPQKDELLESISLAGGKLFAQYLKDVTTRIYQLDIEGKLEREIELPALGTAYGFNGDKTDKEVFYTFTSFTYPPTIFKYNLETGKSDVFKKTEVKINPEEFQVKQVFYPSKDGTKIPMFIVHKKGLILDGKRPTYLYGYGGFNISLTPSFNISRFVLLENDGVFALANLRGGAEYGEEWHKNGMLYKKQNVFDDFIAAAEYLIANKYTNSDKLAIAGGSNGGLLVGATMTQRPELFKVALPAVGVMDMLRYHKFTIGWAWAVEYGSSEDSLASFKNLLSYSPIHNLKEGVNYPATLITTADHDDRVVPAHSFKFAATLQEKHKGTNPVLIRIDKKAGHGAGKPISKTIEEQADIWSFMFQNMGEEPYKDNKIDLEKKQ